jgi:putative thiazole-containing bacteriocin maturation protein
MEGDGIDKWIEKLLPMFNGEYTLGDLTDGLPGPYRERVYQIADVLYRNGFVRDVSKDRPHQLTEQILKTYAHQIEFLDSFGDSGAYRFQVFRQANVLAIGAGPFFVSLVSALLEAGLPKFHMLVTDSVPTNRLRLAELEAHARKTDPEVAIGEITLQQEGGRAWREIVQPFDWIVYVSQQGDIEELRAVHRVCREERKGFLPAMFVEQAGLAGPVVHPDSAGCWESAWRRIHHSALRKDPPFSVFSSTAGAMLANVLVFAWFKTVTGVTEPARNNQFFLLDPETLEGNWHVFLPHPLVEKSGHIEWVEDADRLLKRSSGRSKPDALLAYFSSLTSAESGIFHIWEEGDLKQLPLAQCRVQPADPLSEGPADLLPEMICTGLTHEEARREAGLAGIEAYVSRMAGLFLTALPLHKEIDEGSMAEPQEFVGIGAGETVAEAVCRGLHKCLAQELARKKDGQQHSVSRVHLNAIEDERCRFYLQALTTMQGAPLIGMGEEVCGFPVVWVGTNGRWYGSVGLNVTMALRQALQQAIAKEQNQVSDSTIPTLEVPAVFWEEKAPLSLDIPACEETAQSEVLQSAMQRLKRNHKRLLVFELALEPFLKEELAGVFGVLLREEESQ